MENVKKERNYGIDLLRLISMLMVVILHVLGQGGILRNTQPLTLNGEVFWSLETLCYCAVNVFAIISGFVGLTSKHKATSLISLCLQVLFYAVIITGIEVIILLQQGAEISIKTIINHILPTINSYWYFSAYFCLFFFMPILNYIVENINKNVLKTIGVFVFIVFCCWGSLRDKTMCLNNGYSVLWLAIMYTLGAYMAKYNPLEKCSAVKSLIGYLVCILISVVARILIARFLRGYLNFNLLINYISPTIVLSSVFLVNLFAKLKFKEKGQKFISAIAPMSFGVYLIHCHPFLFALLRDAFSWIAAQPLYLGIPYVLGIALAIFIVCLFLDWLRILVFKLINIKKFSAWIEKIITAVLLWILKLFGITFDKQEKK